MDLLAVGYGSDDSPVDDEDEEVVTDAPVPTLDPVPRRTDRRCLDSAPTPRNLAAVRVLVAREKGTLAASANGPVQGPAEPDPLGPCPRARGVIAVKETRVAYDEDAFRRERHRFQRTGSARAPDAPDDEDEKNLVRSSAVAEASWNIKEGAHKRRRVDLEAQREEDGRRTLVHDSDDEEKYGVWAPPSAAERALTDDARTLLETDVLTPEQEEERRHVLESRRRKGLADDPDNDRENRNFDRLVERKMGHLLPPRLEGEDPDPCEPSTEFHGTEGFDYRGRSWIDPPAGTIVAAVDANEGSEDNRSYVPKKCVHRYAGHQKGVHRIRLFPRTGHLLLSAGLDGTCKVWSVLTNPRQLLRTYSGHTAAVRDVAFNNDGKRFLSCSFDRYIRLWDTESGEVLNTFTNRRVPYVVAFYPKNDNLFVVGCSDAKIVCYDATSGEITQRYDHHLAPVNTITFVEDASRMVTTSDDKKMLVWEWDIGVPIKYVSDPTMHSMPAMVLAGPGGRHLAGQSLDNTIRVHEAGGRFAARRKKIFKGHRVAGYACEPTVSPDGRFLASGDGNGKLFFWDWRTHRVLQRYHAHDRGPAIACVWHPTLPSTVLTCGWDGLIKVWE